MIDPGSLGSKSLPLRSDDMREVRNSKKMLGPLGVMELLDFQNQDIAGCGGSCW